MRWVSQGRLWHPNQTAVLRKALPKSRQDRTVNINADQLEVMFQAKMMQVRAGLDLHSS